MAPNFEAMPFPLIGVHTENLRISFYLLVMHDGDSYPSFESIT